MTKYIFLTGGVCSNLGKGLAAASLAALLKAHGFSVKTRKIDPYLNLDTQVMSPTQHGETYITYDGKEVDLDLGHYERFSGVAQSGQDSTTMGAIYQQVLKKERNFDYGGDTVQIVPHVTNALIDFICRGEEEEKPDFVITEIGGTVGDIEGLPCLEAVRLLRNKIGKERSMFIHAALVPRVPPLGEQGEYKTKPAQHSVKELRSLGIQPDVILCRFKSETMHLSEKELAKIALFCCVDRKAVVEVPDVDNIYELPLVLNNNELDQQVLSFFKMESGKKLPELKQWTDFLEKSKKLTEKVTIGIVGKYCSTDTYLCVIESLKHAGIALGVDVQINWIDAEKAETDKAEADKMLGLDGYIIPGGFGGRGIEGKIQAAYVARTHAKPVLGICLGMQVMIIEFARNVLGYEKANSTEFDEDTPYPVIYKLVSDMRLGSRITDLLEGSLIASIYGDLASEERYRHRYGIDAKLEKAMHEKGMIFTGTSYEGDLKLISTVELKDHPWYIGVQYHPEMLSTPFAPRPLFLGLVRAAVTEKKTKED